MHLIHPLLATFRSPVEEQRYRASQYDDEIRRFSVVVAVLAIAGVSFIQTDYRLHGLSEAFYVLLAVRGVLLATCAGALLLARRLEPRQLDYLILAWGFASLSCGMFINWTRPPDYFGHVAVDVVSAVLIFVFMPGRLFFQAALVTFFASTQLTLLWVFKTGDLHTLTAATGAMTGAVVLGGLASWQLHLSNRHQYAALEAELSTRRRLEAALEELETLRGMVPICSSCKSIRDDAGHWHQMEEYIQSHTLAEFSHGICPQCAGKLFPEDA